MEPGYSPSARRSAAFAISSYPRREDLRHASSVDLDRRRVELAQERGWGFTRVRADAEAGERSTPGSRRTLGGLVALGKTESLGRHIAHALRHAALCTSDPLCAEHAPDADGSSLYGAACHACFFAPETSCERGNRYLDRAALARLVTGLDIG